MMIDLAENHLLELARLFITLHVTHDIPTMKQIRSDIKGHIAELNRVRMTVPIVLAYGLVINQIANFDRYKPVLHKAKCVDDLFAELELYEDSQYIQLLVEEAKEQIKLLVASDASLTDLNNSDDFIEFLYRRADYFSSTCDYKLNR